jgi:hypothetical protein
MLSSVNQWLPTARHQPFEVYKLEGDTYRLQRGEPYWMPEVGLGIGRYQAVIGGISQEILTWYDGQGNRHLSAEEQERQRAAREQQRAERERSAKERLEAYLRSQGIDPDQLPE